MHKISHLQGITEKIFLDVEALRVMLPCSEFSALKLDGDQRAKH